MLRRTFLKLAGLASVAAGLAAAGVVPGEPASLTAAVGSLTYRGQGGLVLVSTDGGQSWRRHTYLGPDYRIARVYADSSRGLHLTVGYGPREFGLSLAEDGIYWLTA